MLALGKYSFGVGDRFAHQAKAQLRACMLAAEQGIDVIPVWNKSHREHTTIGFAPDSVRAAADAAVRELGWKKPYHVDADHIRLETVDGFIASSDFYTIDVADAIGQRAEPAALKGFMDRHPESGHSSTNPRYRSPFCNDPRGGRTRLPRNTFMRSKRRATSIATSKKRKARADSSPKSPWTRPMRRRRRRSCW